MEEGEATDKGQPQKTIPTLIVLDTDRRRKTDRRSGRAALLRCGLIVLIAVAIRLIQTDSTSEEQNVEPTEVSVKQVQPWLPAATSVANNASGVAAIADSSGQVIGFAITTLPAAIRIVGYRGPGNVLLVLDEQSRVVGATLLASDDTPEHVRAVQQDASFFKQFNGRIPGSSAIHSSVDSVSGATLTSLAMAEGIAIRLSGEKPSLRFPDAFDAQDTEAVKISGGTSSLTILSKSKAQVLVDGEQTTLIRTGPLSDSISGYQGPSELLLQLDASGKTIHTSLRRTFDNQPYAGYLNEDAYFWKVFLNKTLRQVSEIDLGEQRVEGVSGATMTSLAVAETMIAAAREFESRHLQTNSQPAVRTIRWGRHDTGTLLVLICGTIIAVSRLRGIRWLRHAWNVILIAYFGLITGNLISLAIVFGWSAKGIAWQLAPGLAAVVVVGFVLPVVTKKNVYCSHICPHGAAQQLMRRRVQPNERFRSVLRKSRWLPGAILIAASAVTILRLNLNLAAWEPFDAYIWYVAGISSIAVAVGSLLLSWFVPMGYCRHACGTGRLLNYIRRSAQSDRLTLADSLAVVVAIAAWSRVIV